MKDDAPPCPVLVLAPPAPPRALVVDVLRGLLERAERGEIVGVGVVTEHRDGCVGTVHVFHDVHRMLGGTEQLRHRLLHNT